MKIVLAEPLGIPEETLNALATPLTAAGHTFVHFDKKPSCPDETAERLRDAEIGIIANSPFPDDAVRRCEKLRMLQVAFTGLDHVGLSACAEWGIPVRNAAGYSDTAVAELTLGMTVSLLRFLTEADRAARGGGTSLGLTGSEIRGKTVGIIGTGHIGLAAAKLFKAFGAELIAFSRTERPEALELGVTYLPLNEVMRRADILTLHIPNTPETRRMIGREQIGLMKKSAVLVNCARGPVLDGAALAEALNAGRLAGAAIDVFDREPPLDASEPLLTARNVLLAPHVGFLTREAMERRAVIVFDNVKKVLGL